MKKDITVFNRTKKPIYRLNTWFQPSDTAVITVDIPSTGFKELKATSGLRLTIPPDPVVEAPTPVMPPVVEKVTEESAVVPVQAVLKEDAPEPLAVEPVEEKEELETVPTPEPAPTPAKAAPVAAYTCPYCTSFKGTKVGLSHHVRVVHPTEYGSFKEEAKS